MADSTESVKKKGWWEGLKSEFGKIIWPTRDSVMKQTVAVVIVSVIVGVLIAAIDTVVKYGFDFIIGL